ncbi:hypothetical protein ACFVWY_04365 [Streptomyces sp. NPDC058195]|uniref:hypothetical protein n=1 Tax=Streptomyces sp. NPDC058195 TaxID=3346375 RepID=UPI0036EE0FD5
MYKIMLDAELAKAFDVWSGYLAAGTGEDPDVRERLRSVLESAREAAAQGDRACARARVAELYEEAEEAGLRWAPAVPSPREADDQARDYVKDRLRGTMSVHRRERLDSIALFLRVSARRLRALPGLDPATREDIVYITARAAMALDLGHPVAAQRELERLRSLERRCGVWD